MHIYIPVNNIILVTWIIEVRIIEGLLCHWISMQFTSLPITTPILPSVTAPPYLLFSYYTGSYNYIQQSRLDGSERTTITFGGRPRALSFDFRLVLVTGCDSHDGSVEAGIGQRREEEGGEGDTQTPSYLA